MFKNIYLVIIAFAVKQILSENNNFILGILFTLILIKIIYFINFYYKSTLLKNDEENLTIESDDTDLDAEDEFEFYSNDEFESNDEFHSNLNNLPGDGSDSFHNNLNIIVPPTINHIEDEEVEEDTYFA